MVTGELNQFAYFSEIEEYFWRKRGAHLLVSPLDWAILETWQKAGIPLQAVLAGIDRAFESYARSKRAAGGRPLKSLAYCVDAVLDAAAQWKEAHAGENPVSPAGQARAAEPFSRGQLRGHLARVRENVERSAAGRAAAVAALAAKLRETAMRLAEMNTLTEAPGALDVEDFERRLTVLEDKLSAILSAHAEDEVMLGVRRELDRALAPYRRRMKAEQIAALERRFLQKRLFEAYDIPRLSLFYLL
jgi:hypothetical protein